MPLIDLINVYKYLKQVDQALPAGAKDTNQQGGNTAWENY